MLHNFGLLSLLIHLTYLGFTVFKFCGQYIRCFVFLSVKYYTSKNTIKDNMPPKKEYIPKEQFWNDRKLYRVLKNDNVSIS